MVRWTFDFGCADILFWLSGRWILAVWIFYFGWVDSVE